jgi:serine/threonine protein kinase
VTSSRRCSLQPSALSALLFSKEINAFSPILCRDNVLLNGHGDAFLADFGIARIVSTTVGQVRQTQMAGTFNYMSPEQVRHCSHIAATPHCGHTLTAATNAQMMEGNITTKADIWAWACSTLHMATGQPPMAGMNPMQIMRRVSVP